MKGQELLQVFLKILGAGRKRVPLFRNDIFFGNIQRFVIDRKAYQKSGGADTKIGQQKFVEHRTIFGHGFPILPSFS